MIFDQIIDIYQFDLIKRSNLYQKSIDFNRFILKIDRFCIKIDIVVALNLEIRIDIYRRSNSDRDFDLKSSIRFADTNRISLVGTQD